MKVFGLFLLLFCVGCKEYYKPPALKNPPDLLVVDGFLNGGPDSTYINLTHTRSLQDTAPAVPESNAILFVEGDQQTMTYLPEIKSGLYGNLLHLNTDERYRLTISTSSGREYRSEYIQYKETPPIDSLNWTQDSTGVHFFLTTHDPQHGSIYYRWQVNETWQYDSYLTSNFDYVNDMIVRRLPEDQIHHCWKNNPSPTILLGTSDKLSQDIISNFQFNIVSKTTEKISVKYSVEVSQYALTQEAFYYWTELKKNSEQTGSIFDAQPSQLNSNIHSLANPAESVLGYLSASSAQKKRIFVDIRQMTTYDYEPYFIPCKTLGDVTTGISAGDKRKAYEYLEVPNHLFTFWYMDGNSYIVAQNFCIDCREHGGTNQKPIFWP